MESFKINLCLHYIDHHFQKQVLPKDEIQSPPPALNWLLHFRQIADLLFEFQTRFLKQPEPIDLQITDNENVEPIIHLLFCPDAALVNKNLFTTLTESFRPITHLQKTETADHVKDYPYAPLITLGEQDIMHLFTPPSNDTDTTSSHTLVQGEFDHRIKYLDSSIWNRYVYLLAPPSKLKTQLETILSSMIQYHKNCIYRTDAARAMLEFQTRMLMNSFIPPFGNHGHDVAVTPFKFHSETWMQQQALRVLKFFQEKQGCEEPLKDVLAWKFLIVDDHADKPISSTDKVCKITKRKVIEDLLSEFELLGKDVTGAGATIEVTQKETDVIEEGLDLMRQKAYDVILLDYLLGKKSGNSPLDEREYGYELLFSLEKTTLQDQKKIRRGALLRYWIVPISSFPHAFTDMLTQLGLSPLRPLWHIAPGSDPVTTPYLFMFNLMEFLQNQVTECYLYPKSMQSLFIRYEYLKDHRQWAMILRREIQAIEAKQELLHTDDSLFAKSIIKAIPVEYDDMLVGITKGLRLLQEWQFHTDLSSKVEEYWSALLKDKNEYSDLLQQIKEFKINIFLYPNNKKAIQKINKVKDGILLSLSGLYLEEIKGDISKTIRELDLSVNKLTDLPSSLQDLKQLRKLDLSSNYFEAVPTVLKDLQNQLHYLNFKGNPVSAQLGDAAEAKDHNSVMILIAALERRLKIKTLLTQGDKIEVAIKEAIQYASNNREFQNAVIMLSQRFSYLKEKKELGTIENSYYQMEINNIIFSLLSFLDKYMD